MSAISYIFKLSNNGTLDASFYPESQYGTARWYLNDVLGIGDERQVVRGQSGFFTSSLTREIRLKEWNQWTIEYKACTPQCQQVQSFELDGPVIFDFPPGPPGSLPVKHMVFKKRQELLALNRPTRTETAKIELDKAKTDLDAQKLELDKAKKDLDAKNLEIANARKDLEAKSLELANTKKELEARNSELVDAKATLNANDVELAKAKHELRSLKSDIEGLCSGRTGRQSDGSDDSMSKALHKLKIAEMKHKLQTAHSKIQMLKRKVRHLEEELEGATDSEEDSEDGDPTSDED